MIEQRIDLGATLRAHRERRGVTLDALAASMKVRRSLLVDLERNDVSQWPQGIYRRAFIRQYAKLVGLSPETVVEQFYALFPEPLEPMRFRIDAEEGGSELRLTLDDIWSQGRGRSLEPSRVKPVAALLGLVLVVSGGLALLTGMAFWTVLGVVALLSLAGAIYGGGALLRRLRRVWQGTSSRSADERPLVLHVADGEQDETGEAFEGDRAEPGDDRSLRLPASGQVH